MIKGKKYWKGLAELNNDPIVEKLAQNEFVEEIPVDNFLGDSGLGATYGDYDGVGKYKLLSFDFPKEFSGFSIGIGLSDFDGANGNADEDGFVITFSM